MNPGPALTGRPSVAKRSDPGYGECIGVCTRAQPSLAKLERPSLTVLPLKLADIETARRQLAGAILHTPMLPAPKLSALTGAEVYVKYENLQVTNSFKDRGALVKLTALTDTERKRGVIAMSAGNHAQSVAYHAARLGIPATIVMPVTTPFVKVAATRSHGAEVVLDGDTVADAQARCETIQAERGMT